MKPEAGLTGCFSPGPFGFLGRKKLLGRSKKKSKKKCDFEIRSWNKKKNITMSILILVEGNCSIKIRRKIPKKKCWVKIRREIWWKKIVGKK